MSGSRRFLQINDELTLLRETHRLVLAWNRLAQEPICSYLINLRPEDLVELDRVLQGIQMGQDALCFVSKDTELQLRGDAQGLQLDFCRRGEAQSQRLELTGVARTRLEAAIEELRKR